MVESLSRIQGPVFYPNMKSKGKQKTQELFEESSNYQTTANRSILHTTSQKNQAVLYEDSGKQKVQQIFELLYLSLKLTLYTLNNVECLKT